MKQKFNPCHCRVCGEVIDRNIEEEGVDWIMPSKNYFYHKSCYDSWKHSQAATDAEWIDYIYDFISRDLKASYDYFLIEAQRTKYLKEKMTNKGIFFSLKYFYEVKGNSWDKGHGGIGIVPYIYTDACAYWVKRERDNKGIVAKIEQQMRDAESRPKRTINKKKKKKEVKIDLSSINMEGAE